MKKLLTMMAAVGMSLGLFAAFTSPEGDNFDSLTPGAFTLSSGWELAEQSATNLTVTAYGSGELYAGDRPAMAPAEAANDVNYLSVKTTFGKPLTRSIDATAVGSGIYFDSLVKFTACDEDPDPANYSGAKLIVYTKEIESDTTTTTNIYVMAGYLNEDNAATNKVYECGEWTKGDAWVRLTIKAISNVSADSGVTIPAFVVFVNGDNGEYPLCCSAARGDTGSGLDNLNDIGAYWSDWNSQNRLFPSLVQNGTDKSTISTVGFDGQGYVDDVTFTQTAPSFATDPAFFTFSWDEHVAGVSYALGSSEPVPLTAGQLTKGSIAIGFTANTTCTITVTPETDYAIDQWTGGTPSGNLCVYDLVAGVAQTGSVTTKENSPKMNITVNGTSIGTATSVADLMTKISSVGSTAKVVVTLTKNLDVGATSGGTTEFSLIDGLVTIDLAGKTITGTANNADGDPVIYTIVPLLIIDSVGEGKITKSSDSTFVGAVGADAGAQVTIGALTGDLGATIEGALMKMDTASAGTPGTISIVRGKFDGETAPTDIASCSECSAVKVSGYWVVEPKAGSGWALYLAGAGTEDDPYKIASEENLLDLATNAQKSSNFATANIYFKQMSDITLSAPFDGIATRNAKDVLAANLAIFTAGAFQGVYDGDGHKISGLILKTGDYIGFFNSTCGATIKNLSIGLGNATGWSDATSGQVGAVFAGVTVNTTITNCETFVDGSYGTFQATKTAAGFVGYAAHGTVIKNCTNNLNIVSVDNTKAGGFIACAQAGKSTGSAGVVLENVLHSGNVSSTSNYCSCVVGYTDLAVTFKGQIQASGTLTTLEGNTVQSLVYVNSGSVALDGATITVPAAYKTVNKSAVDGLFFATVSDGVATLIENASVVASGSYKVMANNAPAITLANIGDTITIDTSLASVTVNTLAEGAKVVQEGNVYTVVKDGFKVTLTWTDANITNVNYSIDDATAAQYTSGTEVTASGKVQFFPQMKDFYKAKYDGADGTGIFTEATNVVLTAVAIQSGDITNSTKTVAEIAEEVGVSTTVVDEIAGSSATETQKKESLNKAVNWAKDTCSGGTALLGEIKFDTNGNPTGTAEQKLATEAYLFNVANSAEAVKAAEEGFKFTSFTPGSGAPTPTTTVTPNGTITVEGKQAIGDDTWLKPGETGYDSSKFYRAIITR